MVGRRVARARRRSVLPADMVDEYLTLDCKSLTKIEKRMNLASADGYKLIKGIKQYFTPETGQHYPATRFWAVMTKRVDPALLAAALTGETVQKEVLAEVENTSTPSGGDSGPPAAPKSMVKREKIYNG